MADSNDKMTDGKTGSNRHPTLFRRVTAPYGPAAVVVPEVSGSRA